MSIIRFWFLMEIGLSIETVNVCTFMNSYSFPEYQTLDFIAVS